MIDLSVTSSQQKMENIRLAARKKGVRSSLLNALWVYPLWYFVLNPSVLGDVDANKVGGYVFLGVSLLIATAFVWSRYLESINAGKKKILALYFEGLKSRHGFEYDPHATNYNPKGELQLANPFFHRLSSKEDHIFGEINGHKFELCEGEVKRGKKDFKFILGTIYKPLSEPVDGAVRIHPKIQSSNWVREILDREDPLDTVDVRLEGEYEVYAEDVRWAKSVINDKMVDFLMSLDGEYREANLVVDNSGVSFAIQFRGGFLEGIDMSNPIGPASFGKIHDDLKFIERLEEAL